MGAFKVQPWSARGRPGGVLTFRKVLQRRKFAVLNAMPCATRSCRPMPAQCASDAAMHMVGIVSPRKYYTKLRYQCECYHKVGSVRSDWEQKCGEKYGVLDICMLVMVN